MNADTINDFTVVAQHDDPVQTVRAVPGGRYLLTGDTERTMRLWSETGMLYSVSLHGGDVGVENTERIRQVAFSPEGDVAYVVVGDQIRAIRLEDGFQLWSVKTPRLWGFLATLALGIDVADDGRIAVTYDNGSIGIRNAAGQRLRTWRDNAAPRWIAFMEGDESLVGSDGFSLLAWSSRTGERVSRWNGDMRVYGFAAHRDGRHFAVRTLHHAQIYAMNQSEPVLAYEAQPGLPLLSWSPQEPLLAIGHQHGIDVVHVTGELNASFPIEGANVLSLDFDAAGRSIYAGLSDGRVVRLWLPGRAGE